MVVFVRCVVPQLQTEYHVTEVCRCLTGRALRQTDYIDSASVIIHHIIQVTQRGSYRSGKTGKSRGI